ncbi:MAG TPA: lysyl oxidase family protein [Candidatus Paceibacterota bacterium]
MNTLRLAIFTLLAFAGVSVYSAGELQPNLTPLPAKDLKLETRNDGNTYLRFSATNWNKGTGPLELIAGEIDSIKKKRNVYQRIYSDGSGFRDVLAGSFIWHEEHGHFHFEEFAKYILQPVNAPGGSERSSIKTTFCIIDTDRINTQLAGAPKFAIYTTCNNDKQGMSVGWGDTYKYYLAGQEINITGLPDGDYNLTIEVDPKNLLLETNDSDNTSNVKIRLLNGRVKIVR